jgi:hypothetical protein
MPAVSSGRRLILIVAFYVAFVASFHFAVGARVPQFFTLRGAHHMSCSSAASGSRITSAFIALRSNGRC